MDNSNSRRLADRYEVRSLIGRGGMAQVHLGFDTRLSRVVAIKMLRADLARDSIFQTRFRREAQAAASLNHPNIVSVYDTGEEMVTGADGKTIAVPYIVMEYVEGHTVKELLSDGTPVPINEAVEITAGILSALEYSHAAGLVHRDIKPGNVMLTNDGKVKVMDFGIARAMTDSQATMTQTNAVVGTAQYLSPEQARGEKVDARSDLYSTGCVLFELLTGRPPFKADSAVAVAYQHVSEVPPAPSSIAGDIPESLDRVVLKAMAKNPADRYATAAVMRLDMIRAEQGQQVDAPPLSAWAAGATAATTPLTSVQNPDEATRAYPGPRRSEVGGAVATSATPALTDTNVDLEPTEGKKKKGRAAWITVLSLLAVALVALVVWLVVKPSGPPEVDEIAVPANLVGMEQAEAKAAIEEAGLVFTLGEPMSSETVAKDLVAEVTPPGGEMVKVGSEVQVRISTGPADLAIPDMTGWTKQQVTDQLTALGLKVGRIEEVDSPEQPKGALIKTDPEMGTSVKSGSTVNLTFATGNVDVPASLVGQSEDDVLGALSALRLTSRVERVESTSVAEGMVIGIDPLGNVAQGTTVKVTVSAGPPPEPEPVPTVTETVPTTPQS